MSLAERLVYPEQGRHGGINFRQLASLMAMQGLLSRDAYQGGWSRKEGVEKVAKYSVEYADALIAQLEKDGK